jgi:hypothetical protein
VDGDGYWIAVSGVQGEAGLLHYESAAGQWETPVNMDEYATGSEDLRLFSTGSSVWAISSMTVPTSLYRLAKTGIEEFSGHDFDVISCASGLAVSPDHNLIAVSCDNELVEFSADSAGITVKRNIAKLPPPTEMDDPWEDQQLATMGKQVLIARNLLDRNTDKPMMMELFLTSTIGKTRKLLQLREHAADRIAVSGDKGLILLRDTGGNLLLITVQLDLVPPHSATGSP